MSKNVKLTNDKTTLKFIVEIIDSDLAWLKFLRDNFGERGLSTDGGIRLNNRISYLEKIRSDIWGGL